MTDSPTGYERRKDHSACWAEYIPLLLLLVIVLGFYSMFWVMARSSVPQENHDLIVIMVQTITGALMLGVGYYFGTTEGSKKKDSTLSNLAAKAAPVLPVGGLSGLPFSTTTTVTPATTTTTTEPAAPGPEPGKQD